MRVIGIAILTVSIAAPAWGQFTKGYNLRPKNIVTIGGGAGIPGGDLDVLDTAPLFTASYARRFWKYAQAETGIDLTFGAAGVRDYLPVGYGYLRIKDNQLAWPFGGRLILPLGNRFEVSGGAGGAYLRYQEYLQQPNNFERFACPDCRSRSGWGYYTTAGVNWSIDRGGTFWLGATGKQYRVTTEGAGFGQIPFGRTNDRWTMISLDFSIRF
jgi:hypothetical protein